MMIKTKTGLSMIFCKERINISRFLVYMISVGTIQLSQCSARPLYKTPIESMSIN